YPAGLNAQETREAHRALKSSPLRQEIYALDGSPQQGIPYSVTANSYIVKLVQNLWGNLYAGFFSHQQENIVWHCERNAADARILHDLTLNVDQYGNVLESAKVAYPRAAAAIPAGTPSVVASTQQVMLVTYTVNAFTNDVIDSTGPTDNYRLREPYESKSYQLTSLSVPAGLWLPANLQSAYAAITGANEIDYSATPSATIPQKRFLSLHRTVYLKDDTSAALTLGTMQSLGLPYQQYQLAMTNAMITDAYGSLVTNSMMTEGGYLREDTITPFASANTNNYWLPGGTIQYSITPSAANTFYSPVGFTDPWGNQTSITYWGSYYLLPASETDALSNVTTVNSYDFRCLQPTEIIDPNTNISDIIYDELCMPVAMALRGKGTGTEGDNLTSMNPDATTDLGYQAAFWSDPEGNAANLLESATWRCVYNLNTSPIAVAMIGREQHYAVNSNSPMQLRITYTDGFGRVAMHKVQAANDPSTGAVRWIGSGKTVYNNKGNVVLQYVPYYSSSFAYDPALQAASAGVSPRVHYDPVGRVIQTDIPDGSFTKTTWNAWLQVAYDNNDTVNDSAWYAARTGSGPLSSIAEEADAAAKATQHYNTPTTIHFDTLAQPFYTVQQNRHLVSGTWVTDPTFESYVVLDVLGNRLAIQDARGLTPIAYRHDMLKGIIRQVSMDSGAQHILGDVAGQPLYTWDADNRQFHFHYDQLRRPSQKDVTPSSGGTKVLEVTVYGEGVGGAAAANLKGMPYKVYDGAGLTTIPSYDFKGNHNTKVRQYVADYTHHPDWTTIGSVAMETATYTTAMTYDALNRPVTITTPDNGVTTYAYEKTGLLYSVGIVNIHGLSSTIISGITYDAKGQRQKVQEAYQNGGGTVTNTTTTAYTYDANTFRVTEIKTTRSSDNTVLQDLKYWYDPVGNI
ncbi:MAG: toxin TcdB middle/C-terminal domain-containing protein, partial [Flavipsychrobacter sp.]